MLNKKSFGSTIGSALKTQKSNWTQASQRCPVCGGAGYEDHGDQKVACNTCKGTGAV